MSNVRIAALKAEGAIAILTAEARGLSDADRRALDAAREVAHRLTQEW